MSYFNSVSPLAETVSVTRVEKQADGKVVEVERSVTLHRCMGIVPDTGGQRCRLVHEGFALAKWCAQRGHVSHWEQTYKRLDGTVDSYPRRAVRRDGPKPVLLGQNEPMPVKLSSPAPVPEATPAAPATPPVLSLDEIKVLALALGYRLSKIPTKAAPQPLVEINPETPLEAFI